MNPLQLDQILPQTVQTLESVKDLRTGDDSFAAALRSAQSENEETKSSDISKTDSDYRQVSEKVEEKPSGNETENDTQKVSKKSSENESKKDSKIAKNTSDEMDAENSAVLNVRIEENKLQLSQIQKNAGQEIEVSALENSENDDLVTDKMLNWLVRTNDVNSDEKNEISPDDFAELIDAAVEFIPGNETEEERLVAAQNSSVNDPERFLEQMAQASEISNGSELKTNGLSGKAETKTARNDSKFTVHDLRTQKNPENAESAKIVQKAASKKEMDISYQQKNDSTMQVTMELANKAESNITSSSAQSAGANGSVYQSMLSNAISENASDIVKNGNIILKDGHQGTINLILKPEALGNVKISLNLNDKVISGQINVQSREAMEAFRESIDALKQAFTESGFETGSFDLNFSSQQGFAQSNDGSSQNQAAGFMAEKAYGDLRVTSGNGSEGSSAPYSENSAYGVNIVA